MAEEAVEPKIAASGKREKGAGKIKDQLNRKNQDCQWE